jgi:inositol oxygenase
MTVAYRIGRRREIQNLHLATHGIPNRLSRGWRDLTPGVAQASSEDMTEDLHLRTYDTETRNKVRETYRKNHTQQTLALAREKSATFGKLNRARMTIWEAMLELDRVIDESDPDTELSQLQHALQTADSLRAAGAPPWLQFVGLVHDAGKMLCLFGEEQWAVVGDTFPLGCAFSDSIVFPELFAENPDRTRPAYASETGIYEKACGLDAVTMAWGHDEYLYQVTKGRLPAEAAFVIRFHSFYPLHQENAYRWMLNQEDESMLPWLSHFQKHDLYSKSHQPPDFEALAAHFQDLAETFLPDPLDW